MGRVLMPAAAPAETKHSLVRAGGWLHQWLWLCAVSAVVQAGFCRGDLLDGLDRSAPYPQPYSNIDTVAAGRSAAAEEKQR